MTGLHLARPGQMQNHFNLTTLLRNRGNQEREIFCVQAQIACSPQLECLLFGMSALRVGVRVLPRRRGLLIQKSD